jgi:hypothetical protein
MQRLQRVHECTGVHHQRLICARIARCVVFKPLGASAVS